jgi:hypothetical protein
MLLVEFWKVSDDTAQDLYHKRGDYFHLGFEKMPRACPVKSHDRRYHANLSP